jgi:hypothetical protein
VILCCLITKKTFRVFDPRATIFPANFISFLRVSSSVFDYLGNDWTSNDINLFTYSSSETKPFEFLLCALKINQYFTINE